MMYHYRDLVTPGVKSRRQWRAEYPYKRYLLLLRAFPLAKAVENWMLWLTILSSPSTL